jgi:hypothetical protein
MRRVTVETIRPLCKIVKRPVRGDVDGAEETHFGKASTAKSGRLS